MHKSLTVISHINYLIPKITREQSIKDDEMKSYELHLRFHHIFTDFAIPLELITHCPSFFSYNI